jgi:hypothetical protein
MSAQEGYAYAADPPASTAAEAPPIAESPGRLDQLVAPIALYPDPLVAQILAASAEPAEIVEADRWMQQHADLMGGSLAEEVDKQPWDPSVKALTPFPAVLANMDKNLSWTSALGDAYVNQQEDVLKAVQAMRQRAQQAGHLQGTAQETVTTEGQTIAIDPEDPDMVYVPEYDPWLVYGDPVAAYPDWYPYPGLFLGGFGVGFGLGIGIGLFAGFGWGWHAWGADWHNHRLTFNHEGYVARGRTFGRGDIGRADFGGGGILRGNAVHGFAAPHSQAAIHSGAFSGFDRGGMARSYSFRGQSSFGGGHSFAGGFHSGGFHGGGFHGGGGGHR